MNKQNTFISIIIPTMNSYQLAKLIRNRREVLQLKQADLAEISGVAIKTIYGIELGNGNPSLDTLTKLLEVLGMELIIQVKKS